MKMEYKSPRKRKSRSFHISLQFHRPRLLSFFVLSFILLFSRGCLAQNSSAASATSVSGSTPSQTSNSGGTSALLSAATPSTVTIPQPFDTTQLTNVGSNFTSSTCPGFIRTFLADPQFQACVPFSMLLYSSSGFFSITRQV